MTAGAVVSPLLGAAAVNGLCGALVLNGVRCRACRGAGVRYTHASCPWCDGLGFVAPSVTPGQHLAVITTRTEPCSRDCGKAIGGTGPQFYDGEFTWTVGYAEADDQFQLHDGGSGRWLDLHLGSVIGSVTATTPALPIVDDLDWDARRGDRVLYTGVGVLSREPFLHICEFNDATKAWRIVSDLSEWLPWLGDDLVGRWAVLIDNPATTDAPNGCPACRGGSKPWTPYGCATCLDNWATAPVPLPDGVDLTEGAIVEVDL